MAQLTPPSATAPWTGSPSGATWAELFRGDIQRSKSVPATQNRMSHLLELTYSKIQQKAQAQQAVLPISTPTMSTPSYVQSQTPASNSRWAPKPPPRITAQSPQFITAPPQQSLPQPASMFAQTQPQPARQQLQPKPQVPTAGRKKKSATTSASSTPAHTNNIQPPPTENVKETAARVYHALTQEAKDAQRLFSSQPMPQLDPYLSSVVEQQASDLEQRLLSINSLRKQASEALLAQQREQQGAVESLTALVQNLLSERSGYQQKIQMLESELEHERSARADAEAQLVQFKQEGSEMISNLRQSMTQMAEFYRREENARNPDFYRREENAMLQFQTPQLMSHREPTTSQHREVREVQHVKTQQQRELKETPQPQSGNAEAQLRVQLQRLQSDNDRLRSSLRTKDPVNGDGYESPEEDYRPSGFGEFEDQVFLSEPRDSGHRSKTLDSIERERSTQQRNTSRAPNSQPRKPNSGIMAAEMQSPIAYPTKEESNSVPPTPKVESQRTPVVSPRVAAPTAETLNDSVGSIVNKASSNPPSVPTSADSSRPQSRVALVSSPTPSQASLSVKSLNIDQLVSDMSGTIASLQAELAGGFDRDSDAEDSYM